MANPPYFEQGIACKNEERELARYTKQSHLNWLEWAATRLAENGRISFVLPYDAGENTHKIHRTFLHKTDKCHYKNGKNTPENATYLAKQPQVLMQDQLVIYMRIINTLKRLLN